MSEPSFEEQTYHQDFERIGTVYSDTFDYQIACKVRLEIYALPCALVEERCKLKGLQILSHYWQRLSM